MIKIENLSELREFISSDIYFTSEAAKFLNISNQRLNQLVQSGKLTPVKSSKAGSLFLKIDLEERLKELSMFETPQNLVANPDLSKQINKHNSQSVFGNDPKIITEAINYFTIQAVFNNSMKKAKPVYEELRSVFNFSEPLINYTTEIANKIRLEPQQLTKIYSTVQKGFDLLSPSDIVVKYGQDFYPKMLELTDQAPPFLFMRGNINLLRYEAVSVVGSRQPSEDGMKRARKLSALLGKHRIVVASGLAKGIDTCAHEAALESGKPTIAVIGTPLTKVYPKENTSLQHRIAEEGLIISQFPPSSPVQRWNFPLRNSIMSGISLATVIVEAGETSGALIQADYALKQNRLVFIPQSALENPRITWPQKYLSKKGAAKFSKIDELISILENSNIIQKTTTKTAEQITLFGEKEGNIYVRRSE